MTSLSLVTTLQNETDHELKGTVQAVATFTGKIKK